jgi:hypothetical protein
MKIKHLLLLLLTILYGYWMSDLYIFVYNNNIYNPDVLDETFITFKVIMYCINYVLIIPVLVILDMYTNFVNKFIKILNKPIKFKKYEN